MTSRCIARSVRGLFAASTRTQSTLCQRCAKQNNNLPSIVYTTQSKSPVSFASFHTTAYRNAQGPSADALMDSLTELYSTAKDEFEIAAEETEKNTRYAEDDRAGAREALETLKEAFQKAVKESDPDVAKEVTSRVGQRIRELENAVVALEESAIEH